MPVKPKYVALRWMNTTSGENNQVTVEGIFGRRLEAQVSSFAVHSLPDKHRGLGGFL